MKGGGKWRGGGGISRGVGDKWRVIRGDKSVKAEGRSGMVLMRV